MKTEELLASLVSRIDEAPIIQDPFDHVYFSELFPEGYYRDLLDKLPTLGEYREFRYHSAMRADGRSTRRWFFLYPEHLSYLAEERRPFWETLSQVLTSDGLQAAFRRKFRTSLEQRFGRKVEDMHFHAAPVLVRDLSGYRIPIHPDTPHKAMTIQFYLPRDDSQAALGTHFHAGETGEAAARSRAMPFLPSSGYAFAVTRASWHSVPVTGQRAGERNSLMLTYYVQDTARDRQFVDAERKRAIEAISRPEAEPMSKGELLLRRVGRAVRSELGRIKRSLQ